MFGTKDRVALLETLIALAHADGDFSQDERDRIEGLIDFFNLKPWAEEQVRSVLENPPQELPTSETIPAYHTRMYVYTQAVMMAFEDGVIDDGERDLLEELGVSLDLSDEDINKAWFRAEELAEKP